MEPQNVSSDGLVCETVPKPGTNGCFVDVDANPLTWKPFPTDALLDPAGALVRAGAQAIRCGPAVLALPLPLALASAIGATRGIRLMLGWTEPSVCPATHPGMGVDHRLVSGRFRSEVGKHRHRGVPVRKRFIVFRG